MLPGLFEFMKRAGENVDRLLLIQMRSGYGKCFPHPGKIVFKEKLRKVSSSFGLLPDNSEKFETYILLLVHLFILRISSSKDLHC